MKIPADKEYKKWYNKGWNSFDLERADRNGNSNNDAWMDGFLDQAAGREKWHLLNCPNHEKCGKG